MPEYLHLLEYRVLLRKKRQQPRDLQQLVAVITLHYCSLFKKKKSSVCFLWCTLHLQSFSLALFLICLFFSRVHVFLHVRFYRFSKCLGSCIVGSSVIISCAPLMLSVAKTDILKQEKYILIQKHRKVNMSGNFGKAWTICRELRKRQVTLDIVNFEGNGRMQQKQN